MSRSGAIIKRTLRSFYDDQMTHHAAALTYYGLMSLFPALLLAISLLGLFGQYPATYDAIIGYLRDVAPRAVLVPLDSSLRSALQSKDTAATAVAISVLVALYGTTGVLEASRRALNVAFEVRGGGRSFLRRKGIDVASTFVLGALVLVSVVMVLVGGGFAEDLLGFLGLGSSAAQVWNIARWPGASTSAVISSSGRTGALKSQSTGLLNAVVARWPPTPLAALRVLARNSGPSWRTRFRYVRGSASFRGREAEMSVALAIVVVTVLLAILFVLLVTFIGTREPRAGRKRREGRDRVRAGEAEAQHERSRSRQAGVKDAHAEGSSQVGSNDASGDAP
jgi:Virulence factor BrkB